MKLTEAQKDKILDAVFAPLPGTAESSAKHDAARFGSTLKTCPFCGSPCELEWTPVPDFSGRSKEPASISWHVSCASVGTRCPMGKHWLCSSAETAVKAWNQRPT